MKPNTAESSTGKPTVTRNHAESLAVGLVLLVDANRHGACFDVALSLTSDSSEWAACEDDKELEGDYGWYEDIRDAL